MNLRTLVRTALLSFCVLPLTAQAMWQECCCPCYDYSINPPILETNACGKFYVEGSYLIWRSHVDNLTPGWLTSIERIDESELNDSATINTEVGEKKFCFKWDSGFRVGVGYDLPCDKWGARLRYTYFRGTGDSKLRYQNVLPELGGPATVLVFTPYLVETPLETLAEGFALDADIQSCWKGELHYVDLDFVREYLVGCYLSLRPILGLRYICLDQKMNTLESMNVVDIQFVPQGTATGDYHAKSCYHGVGIRAGMYSTYEFACGFGIYGDAVISVVYGEYDVKLNAHADALNDLGTTLAENTVVNTKFACCYCAVKPIFDYGIGLYWRKDFNCNRSMFEVKAAWENHIHFFQNQFRTVELVAATAASTALPAFKTDIRSGDVTFSGFSISAAIWF